MNHPTSTHLTLQILPAPSPAPRATPTSFPSPSRSPGAGLKLVEQFLNRVLGLPLPDQGLVFEYFYSCLEAEVARAKADGTYDYGIRGLQVGRPQQAWMPSGLAREGDWTNTGVSEVYWYVAGSMAGGKAEWLRRIQAAGIALW